MDMPDHVNIIAHRGASGLCGQDNTLTSFELAIDLGCDMVELDVRCTSDGQLACFHDPAVGGTRVVDLTFDDLRARSGVDVPTFEQAVRLCSGRIGLNVEIKEPGYERDVIQTLLASMSPGDFNVECFKPEVVAELGRLNATISRGLLADRPRGLSEADTLDAIAATAAETGAEFLSLHHSLLGDALFAHPRLGKLPVYCWTVDDPHRIREVFDYPISGIVTNRPDHALDILGRTRPPRV
jgi:glycerophosphoryl diester phosphodiesterase